MKLKMKSLIFFLALMFSLCLVIGAGYTVARYAGVFDAGEFFLTLVSGVVDPGSKYKLVYHTFDENGVDVVYKEKFIYENKSFTIDEAPEAHNDLTFFGWSPLACHDNALDSYSYSGSSDPIRNQNYTYSENTELLFSDVMTFLNSSGEIHLYDLYEEYNFTMGTATLSTTTDSTTTVGDPNIYGMGIRVAVGVEEKKSNFSDTANTALTFFYYSYEDSVISASGLRAKYRFFDRILYIHPGINVSVLGEHSSGSTREHDETYNIKESHQTTVSFDTEDTLLKDETYSGGDDFDIFLMGRYQYTLNLSVEYKGELVKIDSGGGSGNNTCFASGTLITMADGTKLPVEMLSQGDLVRVYDHENGCYTSSPILFTEYDGDKEWNVINLEFSDRTMQKFIYEHGLFDLDLNKYVYITEENYQDFIGHRFAKEEPFGYSEITLENAWVQLEFTGCYSMTTEYHMNYFVNGMFSMPGGITGLFNFFEYDENLAYDKELMAKDIETYGLFTYEDFAPYMSEEAFDSIFPVKYLKVSIGKGLTTFENLEYIIKRYIYGHGLDG